MSRPRKNGLDYFPLDIDMDQDDKIYILEAELGELAFGRFIKLLTEIYRNGYFKEWTEDDALVFAGKKRIPYEELKKLVDTALKRGLFNKKIFDSYNILTSAGIQKRYIKATEKRKSIQIDKRLKLFSDDELSDAALSKLTYVNDSFYRENEGSIPVNYSKSEVFSPEMSQSKAKHSIEKNSIAKQSTSPDTPPVDNSEAETQDVSPEEVRAAAAVLNLQLKSGEAATVAHNLADHGLDTEFIRWASVEIKNRSAIKSPAGFLKRMLLMLSDYGDWISQYRDAAARASPSGPAIPKPGITVCPICGESEHLWQREGELWCSSCKKLLLEYDSEFEVWIEPTEEARSAG